MTRKRWMEIEERYGPQYKGDSKFARRCRLLQSWYRVEVMKQTQFGAAVQGGSRVGSVLVDGEATGANFVSAQAFSYAKEKVASKKGNPDLTINPDRLFNNMLSSQPMCFNLFADLHAGIRAGSAAAQHTVAAMFPLSRIDTVESMDVEMIPRPIADYIDDKTAFDAAVLFKNVDGQPGLVSIETKYTDHLAGNCASDPTFQLQLAKAWGLLTPDGARHYDVGFDQVARNVLLTLAYAKKHGRSSAINYVVALADDEEAKIAVETLRGRLAEPFRGCIQFLPLETVVARGLATADAALAAVLTEFRRRYLDFSPVDAMLNA